MYEEAIGVSKKESFVVHHDFDGEVGDCHHISVDYNGNNYSVVFGKYCNGGFFSIPNWRVGGELSSFWDDIMWNTDSIGRALDKDYDAGEVIAKAIWQHINKYHEREN